MKGYSARQINDAKIALKLLKVMGHPSKQDFIKMIRGGILKNCEVTEDDVKRMFDILVADMEAVKGKNTRKTPDRVKSSIVALPAEILEKNKIVTLDIDIFFTNKIPFVLSLSQAIILNTVQHLTDRKKRIVCWQLLHLSVTYTTEEVSWQSISMQIMNMHI